jgi:ribose transport system substrate-binding protein
MMRTKHGLLAATALLVIAAGAATAQDKPILAIVVKGLDNPFFEQINLGCQQWMADNPDSEYQCLYTGPARRPTNRARCRLWTTS